MYLINRQKDNITPIVKSLRPIKYLYSKQNKEYDKYFHGSCLKDFVKQINSQRKADFILDPGENINEYDDSNKKDSGIDFKNSLNYFRELSKLKKLPFSKLNKVIINSKRYNSEANKKLKRKLNKKPKLKRKVNLIKIRNTIDSDITLYPGKYNPNYNYIKRRYPCAFFGTVKKNDNSLSQTFLGNNNDKEEENDKKDIKNLNKENSEEKNAGSKTNKNANKKNDKINKKLFMSLSNKDMNFNKKNEAKHNKIKFKFVNDKKDKKEEKEEKEEKESESNKKKKYINSQKQMTSNSFFKEATISSWYNTNEFDKNKKFKKLKNPFYKSQRIFRNNKIRLIEKLPSEDMIKCTVMFDKMQGRERPANFMPSKKEGSSVSYNPNYNFIRPHVRTTIFKSQRKFQEIKKFMTNKIIRSYRYSSQNYFVFDYNKKIEVKKEEKHE